MSTGLLCWFIFQPPPALVFFAGGSQSCRSPETGRALGSIRGVLAPHGALPIQASDRAAQLQPANVAV